MFARVSTFQGSPDQVDEGLRLWREGIGTVTAERGFVRAYLLVDRQSGKTVTISLWATEADLRASEATAARLRSQAPGVTATPSEEVYEVIEEAGA